MATGIPNNPQAGDSVDRHSNASTGDPEGKRSDQRDAVTTPTDHDADDAAIYRAMRRSAAPQRPECVTIDAETLGRVRAALRCYRNMLRELLAEVGNTGAAGTVVSDGAESLAAGVDRLLADITAEVGRG